MGQPEGQRDAAAIQQQQVQHQLDLFNIGAPGVRLALQDFLGDLGSAGKDPAAINALFAEALATNKQQFGFAEDAATPTIEQMALQTGYRGARGAVGQTAADTIVQLERARRANERSLTQQRTDAAIAQRDFNLSQILGIGGGMGAQSMQTYGNALTIAGSNRANPWGGAATGAMGGAAAGTAAMPGWGTLIGALLGGVSGYFQGQGG